MGAAVGAMVGADVGAAVSQEWPWHQTPWETSPLQICSVGKRPGLISQLWEPSAWVGLGLGLGLGLGFGKARAHVEEEEQRLLRHDAPHDLRLVVW